MQTVKDYFNAKADRYDETDQQAYWRFSDELLWHLLIHRFLPQQRDIPFTFLDAGGGTGRWTLRILKAYPHAFCYLMDISENMLAVAKTKFKKHGCSERVQILQQDLSSMDFSITNSIDNVICFHNVIGFIADPQKVLSSLFTLLHKKGRIALMAPSFYHAIYFSNANHRSKELERIIKQRRVCYNDLMPPLRVFEIEEMNNLLKKAGFCEPEAFGFPITFYPGMEETFIQGETPYISKYLEVVKDRLLELERELCLKSSLASRGNNLLFVAGASCQ